MIVGLIFIIIVVLAVLVSVNEQTKPSLGKMQFAGNQGQANIQLPAQQEQAVQEYREAGRGERTTPPTTGNEYVPREIETTEPVTASRQVIILSPFQVAESYLRARSIVERSQCYALLGDVREITYWTSLVGTKFISNIVPNEDYSAFTVTIMVKLADSRGYPVFFREYPVKVDLMTNRITECKGKPIEMQDVMAQAPQIQVMQPQHYGGYGY
ncbi:MAG: hypothetical protein V1743_04540 [Nanoarchaeota archaeon]